MRIYIYSLWVFACFSLSAPLSAHADSNSTPGVKSEKLLETEKSWDGALYKSYPEGTPQLSVLKVTISPYTRMAWHEHPAPNVGYLLEGALTVEKNPQVKNAP